ncbi:MAG: group 1 truncated hemoglobin [Clostridia bacterium]|nr:group 1 truncated hemoglobin [Deltaproteobacteria bacterium]
MNCLAGVGPVSAGGGEELQQNLPVSAQMCNMLPVSTNFERIGGEPKLRVIIETFVDSMFDDVMIGFFFRNVARKHIKELEYQFAAQFLGAPVAYRGRPVREAHKSISIMGGQFARRKRLLEQTLQLHDVPQEIIGSWLAHVESLRGEVVKGPC